MDAELIQLGIELTKLVVSQTATSVSAKIQSVKNSKDLEAVRSTYDEQINILLAERAEAIRIAQVYKSELERVQISDEDIEHLHNTVSNLLDLFKPQQAVTNSINLSTVETIKNLITVDTLKTMQLLGFNYKAALGEPLTEKCAEAIRNWGTNT